MQSIKRAVAVCGAIFLTATAAAADVKVTKSMTMDGADGGMTTVEYVKGARIRTETRMGETVMMVSIRQCDLNRTIQINDAAKTYMIMPSRVESEAPAAKAAPAKKGGVVLVTTTVTDTGERKQISGITARHLKITTSYAPQPGACDQTATRLEYDGWYADDADGFGDGACEQSFNSTSGAGSGGCEDTYRLKHIGAAKIGYPISFAMKMDGTSMAMDTREIVKGPLDAALFEIPAGYKQVSDFAALMGGQ